MLQRHDAYFLQHLGKIERGARVSSGVKPDWRIAWLVLGGLACLAWTAKTWLSPGWCTICTTGALKPVADAPPPPLPELRVSDAGVYYGECAGIILAVVLLPEPCGWGEAKLIHALASR